MTNKYCYYTSSCIMRNTFLCIKKCLLSLYNFLYNEKYLLLLYIVSYNRNILSCIKKYLLSLHVLLYNKK